MSGAVCGVSHKSFTVSVEGHNKHKFGTSQGHPPRRSQIFQEHPKIPRSQPRRFLNAGHPEISSVHMRRVPIDS